MFGTNLVLKSSSLPVGHTAKLRSYLLFGVDYYAVYLCAYFELAGKR